MRRKKGDKIEYTNIRHLIDNMEIKELVKYNIGIGAATNRTAQQQELAQKYTNKIIQNSSNHIIFVDGSINIKDDPRTTQQRKHLKQGYGGYGGIVMNKRNQKILEHFKDKVNTNDPQYAELEGIKAALNIAEHMYHVMQIKEISILCDCKNAVKYISGESQVPYKYSETIQNIREQQNKIEQYMTTEINWIPGHTDNKWNDKADELAKTATKLWLKQPPVSRSLDGMLRPSGPGPPTE